MAVLESIARAYAELKTLSAEIVSVTESKDDGSSSRGEHRTKVWFEAPDKVRIETSGRNGMILVSDGVELHTFFALPKRYSKSPAFARKFVPGEFRPEHASLGATPPPFLFSRIADKVVSVEVLAEEAASLLLSVNYEQMSHPHLWLSSPVQYSIDSKTRLVSRMEGEVSVRMPRWDHETARKHTISFVNAVIDGPIVPDVFTFTPPADAVEASHPPGTGWGFSGGGRAGVLQRPGGRGRFARHRAYEWEGETLIERSDIKMHDVDLIFERRLTLSEDRSELKVSERIIGPAGEVTHDLSVPLA